jgi:hypothetical protein
VLKKFKEDDKILFAFSMVGVCALVISCFFFHARLRHAWKQSTIQGDRQRSNLREQALPHVDSTPSTMSPTKHSSAPGQQTEKFRNNSSSSSPGSRNSEPSAQTWSTRNDSEVNPQQPQQPEEEEEPEDWVVTSNLCRGHARSSWSEPAASDFCVRDSNYLTDKKKQPSLAPLFSIVGVNAFWATTPTDHVAVRSPSLAKYLREHHQKYSSEFFIINWMLPGNKCTVYLFARNQAVQDPVALGLYRRFCTPGEENDQFRKTRLKYRAIVNSAPWVIKNTAQLLGAERPAILGGNLKQRYHYGENYFEVDIDIR